MIFSNTGTSAAGTKNGIIQTVEFLLDFPDGGISGDSTKLAQITNILNTDAYPEVISEIIKNEGTWLWDDFNEGTSKLPVASQNLTTTAGSEVSAYSLPDGADASGLASSDPSSFLRLIKVQVKNSAGDYYNLSPIDENVREVLDNLDPGLPQYYDLIGNSIILYPAPLAASVTATNGLKITFQRSQVQFTVTGNDTQMPGFPDIYHYLLALITSETYAAVKGMKQLPFLTQKKLKFMENLGWGVANRNKDLPLRITTRTGSYE